MTGIFWMLYAASLLAILIPTVFGAYDALFDRSTLSPATWRVLFCLYGAPVLMILFLPVTDHNRLKSEVFLDLLQVMILVGLIFFAFFLLPVQQMMPTDALLRNVNISNLQSLFLLGAVIVRFLFMRAPNGRNLLIRLGSFVLTCAVVTFTGNWIDVHHRAVLSAWFDVGWALPYVVGGLAALTWTGPVDDPPPVASPRLPSFLISNIALVTLLCLSVGMLMGPWLGTHNKMLTVLAAGASLLAFTVRLALTQYHQQLEITQRKAAEEELRKLASIVEFSGDAIYGNTLEGKITSWNKAAENMYGYTAAEVVGKDVSALMPAEHHGELQAIMERVGSGHVLRQGNWTQQISVFHQGNEH